jgi:hypothetical protein
MLASKTKTSLCRHSCPAYSDAELAAVANYVIAHFGGGRAASRQRMSPCGGGNSAREKRVSSYLLA